MADDDLAALKRHLEATRFECDRLRKSAKRYMIRKQFQFAASLNADANRREKEIAELEAKIRGLER
jgi:hypothetical protein